MPEPPTYIGFVVRESPCEVAVLFGGRYEARGVLDVVFKNYVNTLRLGEWIELKVDANDSNAKIEWAQKSESCLPTKLTDSDPRTVQVLDQVILPSEEQIREIEILNPGSLILHEAYAYQIGVVSVSNKFGDAYNISGVPPDAVLEQWIEWHPPGRLFVVIGDQIRMSELNSPHQYSSIWQRTPWFHAITNRPRPIAVNAVGLTHGQSSQAAVSQSPVSHERGTEPPVVATIQAQENASPEIFPQVLPQSKKGKDASSPSLSYWNLRTNRKMLPSNDPVEAWADAVFLGIFDNHLFFYVEHVYFATISCEDFKRAPSRFGCRNGVDDLQYGRRCSVHPRIHRRGSGVRTSFVERCVEDIKWYDASYPVRIYDDYVLVEVKLVRLSYEHQEKSSDMIRNKTVYIYREAGHERQRTTFTKVYDWRDVMKKYDIPVGAPFSATIHLQAHPANKELPLWMILQINEEQWRKKKPQRTGPSSSEQIQAAFSSTTNFNNARVTPPQQWSAPRPVAPPPGPPVRRQDLDPTWQPAILVKIPGSDGLAELWGCKGGAIVRIDCRRFAGRFQNYAWFLITDEHGWVTRCVSLEQPARHNLPDIQTVKEKPEIRVVVTRDANNGSLICHLLNCEVFDEDRQLVGTIQRGYCGPAVLTFGERGIWSLSHFFSAGDVEVYGLYEQFPQYHGIPNEENFEVMYAEHEAGVRGRERSGGPGGYPSRPTSSQPHSVSPPIGNYYAQDAVNPMRDYSDGFDGGRSVPPHERPLMNGNPGEYRSHEYAAPSTRRAMSAHSASTVLDSLPSAPSVMTSVFDSEPVPQPGSEGGTIRVETRSEGGTIRDSFRPSSVTSERSAGEHSLGTSGWMETTLKRMMCDSVIRHRLRSSNEEMYEQIVEWMART